MRVHYIFSVLSPICYGSQRFIAVTAYLTQKQTMSDSHNTVRYNPVHIIFPPVPEQPHKKFSKLNFLWIFLLLVSTIMCCLFQSPNRYTYNFNLLMQIIEVFYPVHGEAA